MTCSVSCKYQYKNLRTDDYICSAGHRHCDFLCDDYKCPDFEADTILCRTCSNYQNEKCIKDWRCNYVRRNDN